MQGETKIAGLPRDPNRLPDQRQNEQHKSKSSVAAYFQGFNVGDNKFPNLTVSKHKIDERTRTRTKRVMTWVFWSLNKNVNPCS
jgi:hypothetical protein